MDSKKQKNYSQDNFENVKKIVNFYYIFILIFIAISGIWPLFFIVLLAKKFIYKFLEKRIDHKKINTSEMDNIKLESISDIIKNINSYIKIGNRQEPNSLPDINKDYKYIPRDTDIKTTVQNDSGRAFLTVGVFIFLFLLLLAYYALKV